MPVSVLSNIDRILFAAPILAALRGPGRDTALPRVVHLVERILDHGGSPAAGAATDTVISRCSPTCSSTAR
ncbi:MAG: hypothetical protein JWN52_7579 [Actinomycetia bacterium]|nr:hypothetical protein [Actinomycetes bacterium]